MRPGVDSVVVNYRTPGDLDRFIDSWVAHRGDAGNRLVVVNVSPTKRDLEVAIAASRDCEDIVGLNFTENVGYARACNAGSYGGESEVLALFNADVQLTPGALEHCYDALVIHPDWGVLGPRQVNTVGKLTHGGIIGTNREPKHRAWHHTDKGQYTDIVEDCPTVSGAAYFIKRVVWDELTECPLYADVAPDAYGAFLPTQHYYEETYCSYHARQHGWKVVYFGEATIVHKWHQASPVGGEADQEMPRSREYFRRACAHHGIECD